MYNEDDYGKGWTMPEWVVWPAIALIAFGAFSMLPLGVWVLLALIMGIAALLRRRRRVA